MASIMLAVSLFPLRAEAMLVPLETCAQKTTIAHRGKWDATHTENTLRAYQYAVESGSGIVELDTQITRDGQWVMMHDWRISRTTDKWGYVKKRTLSYIKSARTNDGVLGGVPTLQETFAYFQSQPNVNLLFEVKTKYVSDYKLTELLAMIEQYGLKNRITFELADTSLIDRIYARDPSYPHSLIVRGAVAPEYVLQHHVSILVIRYNYVTPEIVDTMHANGIKVYAWTIDTESPWRTSISANVDAIITNRPDTTSFYCANAVKNANPVTPAP